MESINGLRDRLVPGPKPPEPPPRPLKVRRARGPRIKAIRGLPVTKRCPHPFTSPIRGIGIRLRTPFAGYPLNSRLCQAFIAGKAVLAELEAFLATSKLVDGKYTETTIEEGKKLLNKAR